MPARSQYMKQNSSYVTRMQIAEIKHLAFCYFLRDVVSYIVGLGRIRKLKPSYPANTFRAIMVSENTKDPSIYYQYIMTHKKKKIPIFAGKNFSDDRRKNDGGEIIIFFSLFTIVAKIVYLFFLINQQFFLFRNNPYLCSVILIKFINLYK